MCFIVNRNLQREREVARVEQARNGLRPRKTRQSPPAPRRSDSVDATRWLRNAARIDRELEALDEIFRADLSDDSL